jgi:hypothetical protein
LVAADVPAAAELLAQIASTPACDLSDAAAVGAVASALTSVMKRSTACIAAAGAAQAQAGLQPAANKAEAAVRCFPAAVPEYIMKHCLHRLACRLSLETSAGAGSMVQQQQQQQQQQASKALLAVLLAKSLLMLADAMEAAAAAAGMTPAQLFAR